MKNLLLSFLIGFMAWPMLAQQPNNFFQHKNYLHQNPQSVRHTNLKQNHKMPHTGKMDFNLAIRPNNEMDIEVDSLVLVFEDGSQKRINTYDHDGNILTELIQVWENGAWRMSQAYTFTYNVHGNRLTALWQDRENGVWVNNSIKTYTYANENLDTILTQLWENEIWVNSWLNTFTCDVYGNWLTQLAQGWDNRFWANKMKATYSYNDNGNMLTEVLQGWGNSTWNNFQKYTNGYDDIGDMVSSLVQVWDGHEWINETVVFYTYNELQSLETASLRLWSDDSWLQIWKYTYAYDDNNYWLTSLFQVPFEGIWVDNGLYTNTNNNNGDRLTYLNQQWDNDTWVDVEKQEYQFIEGQINAVNYDWDGSNWAESIVNKYLEIFMGGEFILSAEAIKFEVFYTDVTSIEEQHPITKNKNIHCFPNPATYLINIQINPVWQAEYFQIELFSQTGQRVKSIEISSGKSSSTVALDVGDLPPGLYLLHITSGQLKSTQKIIISK